MVEYTPPVEIPQAVVEFSDYHSLNHTHNPNLKIYKLPSWNGFDVYTRIDKSLPKDGCFGGPVYFLHNGKNVRYAKGKEIDQIWMYQHKLMTGTQQNSQSGD